jgi:hypothetical protein
MPVSKPAFVFLCGKKATRLKTMPLKQISGLANGIYAIAGISKNSGKTSLLNSLLANLQDKTAGVLTTGRDGEERDVVFGNPKPSLMLSANTLFTTSSGIVDKLGTAVQVMEKLPFPAGGKPLWLVKALRDIETEITGPANVSAQMETARIMLQKGADTVFIDGSLDRKSVAMSPDVNGVFLVVGGSFGNLEKLTSELARQICLAGIKPYRAAGSKALNQNIAVYSSKGWQSTDQRSLLGFEGDLMQLIAEQEVSRLYLPGAVTDTVYNSLKPALKEIKEIVVRHPLNLHLKKSNLEHLTATHKTTCLHPFKIVAVAVNSWSVSGNHIDSSVLRSFVRERFPALPIIDVREG